MNTNQAIITARKHLHNGAVMATSAESCIRDAINCYDDGNFESARMWAVKSLAYSVGITHKDYKRASK